MPDYVETSEADLVVQLNDHAAGMTTHGAALGFAPDEVAQAGFDAHTASLAVNQQSIIQSKAEEWTQFKRIVLYAPLHTPLPETPVPHTAPVVLPGAMAAIVARFRQRAERAKAHPAYTPAIGEDLRIVAPIEVPGPVKPALRAVPETAFAVRLTFAMSGRDQLEIFSRRGGGGWEMITVDTNSPYVDGRAPLVPGQPEVREYRARFRDNDLPVGEWSDVIAATAQA
jgi:hypothetical protein